MTREDFRAAYRAVRLALQMRDVPCLTRAQAALFGPALRLRTEAR